MGETTYYQKIRETVLNKAKYRVSPKNLYMSLKVYFLT